MLSCSASAMAQTANKADSVLSAEAAGVKFDMVYVKGGTFNMGSENGGEQEQPVHSVTVPGFYIGQTEVTQRLWEAVMGSNPSNFKNPDYPVENVTWEQTQVFVDKLSRLAGRTFRLPYEAEWEYAARGGRKSKGFKYSGSNRVRDVAWYGEDRNTGSTHQVAKKKPNELGLYDMSGNVWEWCQDIFSESYYSVSPAKSPKGPEGSTGKRVLRGGSWFDIDGGCTTYIRDANDPAHPHIYYGLRLVISGDRDDSADPDEEDVEVVEVVKEEPKQEIVSDNKQKGESFSETINGVTINMVYVEGGVFQMGSNDKGDDDSWPQHEVELDGYYIMTTEVPQILWNSIMPKPQKAKFKGDLIPVHKVSVVDVQEFLKVLNEKTGRNYRLPTEAEWEFAARGGNQSHGYKFSGSDEFKDVCLKSETPYEIAKAKPNELGLYDMTGNVWEWCSDKYHKKYYRESPRKNPQGYDGKTNDYVLRGGAWYCVKSWCRVIQRNSQEKEDRQPGNGFRLALSLDGK